MLALSSEKHWPLHKKQCKTPTVQEAGARQQEHRNMRLFNASILGDLPTVTALIAEGADVNFAHPWNGLLIPLHVASQGGIFCRECPHCSPSSGGPSQC